MSEERLSRRGERGEGASNSDYSEQRTSVYLPGTTLSQIRAEASRLDRSVSWLIAHMWSLCQDQIKAEPSLSDDNG